MGRRLFQRGLWAKQIAFGWNRDCHRERKRSDLGKAGRSTIPGSPRRHSPSKDGRLSTPYGFLAMTIPYERSAL
jgi:hypothetical protein